MNYRHIYHAGSFADVFKHAILVFLVKALQQKDKGFCYIDTHAGIGYYDLSDPRVSRNPEYLSGIVKAISDSPANSLLQPYLEVIQANNPRSKLTHYLGSPAIVYQLLRPQDEMVINELHPDDALHLKQSLPADPRVHIHQRDAYEFLPGVLPPTLNRGIILIDPPYEISNEYTQIKHVLNKAVKRFKQGVYVLWYPIKSSEHQSYLKSIINQSQCPHLNLELKLKSHSIQQELIGCGMLILNPPWKIEETLTPICNYLQKLFGASEF